jgi:signal peptidase II
MTMARRGRFTRLLVVTAIVTSTISCDRVTKRLAVSGLSGRPRESHLADLVRLELVRNPGGFLSAGAQLPEAARTTIFSLGTAVLVACVGLGLVRRLRAGGWGFGFALVWAGGVANLADRLLNGSVIDFLNVGLGSLRTGIFNVADVAITLGLALIVVESWLGEPGASLRAADDDPRGTASGDSGGLPRPE